MRDSIPPFLGLFLGCPVVRSLSWCGRREEGRTRGADWHPTANLWQSLTMISPSHSFIVLFQPFPFEKNLEIHFFRLCFVKLKLLLLAIEVSQTILVRSSFLTEVKAPFVLRHSPCSPCSENHSFAITSFTLIARWSQTMAATQRFQSTLDEARWKNWIKIKPRRGNVTQSSLYSASIFIKHLLQQFLLSSNSKLCVCKGASQHNWFLHRPVCRRSEEVRLFIRSHPFHSKEVQKIRVA